MCFVHYEMSKLIRVIVAQCVKLYSGTFTAVRKARFLSSIFAFLPLSAAATIRLTHDGSKAIDTYR